MQAPVLLSRMPRALEDAPRIAIRSRADLRAFPSAHHAKAGTHWLVTIRKPSPDHVPYLEIVQELICRGWIGSLPRALDDLRTMLMIAPRKGAAPGRRSTRNMPSGRSRREQ